MAATHLKAICKAEQTVPMCQPAPAQMNKNVLPQNQSGGPLCNQHQDLHVMGSLSLSLCLSLCLTLFSLSLSLFSLPHSVRSLSLSLYLSASLSLSISPLGSAYWQSRAAESSMSLLDALEQTELMFPWNAKMVVALKATGSNLRMGEDSPPIPIFPLPCASKALEETNNSNTIKQFEIWSALHSLLNKSTRLQGVSQTYARDWLWAWEGALFTTDRVGSVATRDCPKKTLMATRHQNTPPAPPQTYWHMIFSLTSCCQTHRNLSIWKLDDRCGKSWAAWLSMSFITWTVVSIQGLRDFVEGGWRQTLPSLCLNGLCVLTDPCKNLLFYYTPTCCRVLALW